MPDVVRLNIRARRTPRPEAIPGLADAVANAGPDAIAAVGEIYTDLQTLVDARKPVCTASGKCCHFDAYGHRLYVTTLELAAFVANLKVQSTHADPGGCPFQVDGLCAAHNTRPFGCRIYYCDPTAQTWQQDQYEIFHARIKSLHEQTNTPYFYVEWRAALASLDLSVKQRKPAVRL